MGSTGFSDCTFGVSLTIQTLFETSKKDRYKDGSTILTSHLVCFSPDLLGKGGGEQKIDRLDFFLTPPPSLT